MSLDKPLSSYFHGRGKSAKMYHVYRNNEGYLGLWRGKQDKDAQHDRIITTCREESELFAYLNPPKKKRVRYNPHKDVNQLKIE
jgi:hypothetical protein